MKKIALFLCLLTLSGCAQGVSQKEYDELKIKNQLLQEKLDNVLVSGTCKGSFVATVRGFSQDYVSDEENRIAIVTEFQGNPFMIALTEDQLKNLEVGKAYVFLIENKDISVVSDELAQLTGSVQQYFVQYHLVISSVNLATEAQSGMSDLTITCTPN
jgi:hypothetical protein